MSTSIGGLEHEDPVVVVRQSRGHLPLFDGRTDEFARFGTRRIGHFDRVLEGDQGFQGRGKGRDDV